MNRQPIVLSNADKAAIAEADDGGVRAQVP
jgi:hypothetical protein